MLENLDVEYLGTLQHAYGYATDVAGLLNDIRSDSKNVRDKAYYELFGNIYHQGTVYEATVYVLPFLIEMFNDPSMTEAKGKGDLASLIAAIAGGNGYYEVHQHWIDKKTLGKMIGDEADLKNELDKERRITERIREIANPIIPLLIPYLEHEDYGVRDSIVEALPYYPDHYAASLPALEKACAVEPEEMSKELMEEAIASIKGIEQDEKNAHESKEFPKIETNDTEGTDRIDLSESSVKPKDKRSVLAILSGLALIGVCLLFVAVDVAGFFHPIDPPFFPLFLAPFAILLAYLAFKQYCTLFCCDPIVSRAYYEAYFGLGGLLVFGAIVNVMEDFSKIVNNKDALIFLGGMLLCGMVLLAIACFNRTNTLKRQHEALKSTRFREEDFNVKPFSVAKYRAREFVGIVLMLMIIASFVVFFVLDAYRHPISGEHLTYEQLPYKNSFPAEGRDFSFWRGYRGTMVCEFTINEKGFQEWITSQKKWEYCRPIQKEDGFSIPKYGNYSGDFANEENLRPAPTAGLYAGYGKGKGGRAVFDSKTNRAYYWTYY